MSEEHKNCKYRFKGKSCKDCPLNCKFKRLEQQTEAYQLLDNEAKEIITELKYKLKRLQEENYELKSRNANLRLNLATYDLPEVKKVLTDWRTGELDKKFKKLQKENEELYKTLEEIRGIAKNACDSSVCHYNCKQCSGGKIIEKINEVLNDRD